jgi:hypothetical protein
LREIISKSQRRLKPQYFLKAREYASRLGL